ncbi:MAG: 3-deoxy-D-manno-octulosonic acid kinase [Planctomycetes bacterium]|nr:3-deoxy-D-manno-octulosonic acid kinase [Planctomycetota bacterium]
MPAEATVTFDASGLRWTAEAATAEAVRAGIAGRLGEIDGAPGVAVLKRNLVRAVFRVPMPGGGRVIVKRYRVSGAQDVVKYAVKDSRAKTEWDVGRALDAAGIPTSVPLAFGERRAGGVLRDAALVTREIPDALHLNAFVEKHMLGGAAAEGDRAEADRRAALRGALYDALARLVRRMHDAGFVHNDFHGGNLLVNGPPDAPSLHVIDLHSVTRPARPSESARWFDLVKLLHSMLTCSTEEERRRICETYATAGGPSGTRVERLLAEGALSAALEPELARMELRRVRSRTDRSLARSSKFDVTAAEGMRVHHLRTLDARALAGLVAPHLRDVAAKARNVLKDGSRSALTRQSLPPPEEGGAPRSVIVKQYRRGGAMDRAKNLVRTPRAVAAWVAGNGLLVRGFDAAEPLALLVRGRGAALGDAFLVMEDLGDGTRSDLVVLARHASAPDAARRAEKRALVEAAASLVRRLHDAGVYHGDLKAVNLFLRRGAAAGPRLVLADYDRVEFDRRVPFRRRVKNLAQLSASVPVCISLADRLRFFRAYAAGRPEVAAGWKEWFRRVAAECRRKIVVRMDPIE